MTSKIDTGQLAGELADLVTVSYPSIRLSQMMLTDEAREDLTEVVVQYMQRDKLRRQGLSPKRKIFIVGPPGCGKTMTASALAGDCSLPLIFVNLHTLIEKHGRHTADKLSPIFDSMNVTRGVYLFDHFGAICSTNNMGRFYHLLEQDKSESIIVAVCNIEEMLDNAFLNRFDDVIFYHHPDANMTKDLVSKGLSGFELANVECLFNEGLSHADIMMACKEAAKKSAGTNVISYSTIRGALNKRSLISRKGRQADGVSQP
jgi:SpoVK/Ycf46/Vps4 family AAA+-type ATPase